MSSYFIYNLLSFIQEKSVKLLTPSRLLNIILNVLTINALTFRFAEVKSLTENFDKERAHDTFYMMIQKSQCQTTYALNEWLINWDDFK